MMLPQKLVGSLAVAALLSFGQQPPSAGSPAEQAVALARKAIENKPGQAQPYNDLAMALARRARDTADTACYVEAEKALDKSLAIEPDNFAGLKVKAWILLGKHEFAEALKLATKLNRKFADDVAVYGLMTDAQVELGNYKEAEESAQWMLDLGRASVPGLTRAAYLRELFGDIEGAIELMDAAHRKISPGQLEDRAWILTQLGHLHLQTGKVEIAEQIQRQALALFPQYHFALANLAKVRTAQQKYGEAADLLRQRYQTAPHPENLYDLAVALVRAGRSQEAKTTFAKFEQKAWAEMQNANNANRELVFYYADHARKPAEALRVAQLEISRRQDVYTMDAYAWALYRNGQFAEARKQLEKALAVGIRDPKFFYHAGVISAKMKDREAAARYLEQSMQLNAKSEVAAEVRAALGKVKL
jgi:tetratricopeptide (TPR) repeat protein